MNAAVLPASPPIALRLPASLAVSLAIHVVLLVSIGVLLRAMPATLGPQRNVAQALTADIITLPELSPELTAPLPALAPVEPIREMMPPPVAPVSRNTPEPGLSTAPATIQASAEFAPVGRISYRFGDGVRLFGADLAKRMAARFPEVAARPPRIDGSLSAMYPVKAAREGRSQALSALVSIDAQGHITDVRVLPDDPVFAAAVMAAVRNARFQPAQILGKPAPYWAVLDFTFKIDGPTGPDGKLLDR
jgi:TonB family protein